MYATKTRRWSDEFFAGVDPPTVMMVEGLEPEVTEESDLAVWFSCDEELLPRKVAAMRAQASQIEPFADGDGTGACSRPCSARSSSGYHCRPTPGLRSGG